MTRPDPSFIQEMESLQGVYLAHDDPIMQSGYFGGRERWVAERSPLVQAIHRDGDFLDVGCANGQLAEDVVTWAAEQGRTVVPHGVDIGADLIELARRRFREQASHFVAADAWAWEPGRTFDFVYSLLDLAPDDLVCPWLERLAGWVRPGGRLIIGSYRERSQPIGPADVSAALAACGFAVSGTATGGDPPSSNFAWVGV
ncbi:MAG TPA: class I SAM-dependent methyltransferase [Acidimicrobiia bacterium]|nr:class I SAM-dependent methyltransferase [Acidimicrobiia bacterium]